MKSTFILSGFVSFSIGLAATGVRAQAAPAPASATAPAGFATRQQAVSYAIGLDMVRNFRSQEVAFDIEQLVQGMRDAAATPQRASMSDEEARVLVAELEGQVRSKMVAARRQVADTNARKTDDFLKKQAAAEGMKTTSSGLMYRVLRAGQGPLPTDSSIVKVNYTGSLPDGKIFDSSQPDKPAQLKISALIPGWREALKLMPTGSKWYLVVPPALAYGERGASNVIGPNQALVFDIELLGVQ